MLKAVPPPLMFSHLFRRAATSDSFVPLILVAQDQSSPLLLPFYLLKMRHPRFLIFCSLPEKVATKKLSQILLCLKIKQKFIYIYVFSVL